MGLLDSWAHEVSLTIDHTKISADLTNFPVLAYLSTSSGLSSVDLSCIFSELGSDANRKKIAVTTSDGITQCYIEIDKWDTANKKAWLWIKVPNISHTVDTTLYLYYDHTQPDNTTYVGDIGDTPAKSVWDTDFKAVYHMRDKDTNKVADSTANGNDLVKVGAGNPALITSGVIDDAQQFNGDSSYASIPFVLSVPYTLEFFACPDDITLDQAILAFDNSDSGGGGVVMGIYHGGDQILIGQYSYQNGLSGISSYLTNGVYEHWCDVVHTTSNISFYLAGVLKSLVSATYFSNGAPYRLVGARHSGTTFGRFFKGKVDEVRISDNERSASWVYATRYTGKDLLLVWSTAVYHITGITRDSSGVALGDCTVDLFRSSDKVLVQTITSDGSGNYSFVVGDTTTQYFVRAYKDGTPNVFGVTDRDLVGS
jgi:hypothetical protein